MRVLLVGRPADRDRLRPGLVDAGIEIAAEAAAQPPASSWPGEIDAVVVAASDGSGTFTTAREERLDADGRLDGREPLTMREMDVLALVAEGLPNKAIAAALGISDQTVKFHVAQIIGKLGAANRTDAVRLGVRRGLVAL
jgi:DNA-binding NarL/FixJ family response regulator